jgi:UDP-N-acetylmuramoyl-tripeptide--D-alanyl-D-alanine ligase
MFLGGMMELGEESIGEHQSLVDLIKKTEIRNVVLVGGDFAFVDHNCIYLPDAVQVADWIRQNLPSNALILIKGSRGIKMEKLLDAL